MTSPYYPATLATPVVNPRVGGFIRPLPYLSISQYKYAPTAMDMSALAPNNTALGPATDQDEDQVLYDVIARASAEIDRYVYGVAEAAKGASLCASQSVEDLAVLPMRGFLNLQCDYWPILQLDGLEVGPAPSLTSAVAQSICNQARFGIRTIKVPVIFPINQTTAQQLSVGVAGPDGKIYCVWTYTAGFPHLELAADVAANATSLTVIPNGPNSSVLGVYPGDPMSIEDGTSDSESFTVGSVSGTTITLAAGTHLAYAHTVPAAPDFVAVTAVPSDVQQAAIFMVTALIKSRGDAALVLQGIEEPKKAESSADAIEGDLEEARRRLDPYRSIMKQRS